MPVPAPVCADDIDGAVCLCDVCDVCDVCWAGGVDFKVAVAKIY